MNKKKYWYDYLWIWSIVYFVLGFFNILFAWLFNFFLNHVWQFVISDMAHCKRRRYIEGSY